MSERHKKPWHECDVIVVQEGWLASLIRDAGTLATFAAMIGLGVYLESTAMQWIGGMLFLLWVAGRFKSRVETSRYTITEARAKLDEIERRQTGGS